MAGEKSRKKIIGAFPKFELPIIFKVFVWTGPEGFYETINTVFNMQLIYVKMLKCLC